MIDLKALGQKVIEYLVIGALVGVIGYLVGNNEAMTMKAEIDRLKSDILRHETDRLRAESDLRRVQQGRRVFMNTAAGPLNYLCEKDAGCRSRYDALQVPE